MQAPLEQPLLPASKEQFRPQLLHTQVAGRPCWTKLTPEEKGRRSLAGLLARGSACWGGARWASRSWGWGRAGVTLAEEPTCAKAGNPQASGEEREVRVIVRVRGRAGGGGPCGIFPSRSSHPGRVVPAGVRCVFPSRHEAPGGRPRPSLSTSKSRALLSKCLLAVRDTTASDRLHPGFLVCLG